MPHGFLQRAAHAAARSDPAGVIGSEALEGARKLSASHTRCRAQMPFRQTRYPQERQSRRPGYSCPPYLTTIRKRQIAMLVGAFLFPTDYGIEIGELARALEERGLSRCSFASTRISRLADAHRIRGAASCRSAIRIPTIRLSRCRLLRLPLARLRSALALHLSHSETRS